MKPWDLTITWEEKRSSKIGCFSCHQLASSCKVCLMYIIQWKIVRNPLSNVERFGKLFMIALQIVQLSELWHFKPLPHGAILNSLLTPWTVDIYPIAFMSVQELQQIPSQGLPFRCLFRYVSRCRWSRIFLLLHQACQAEGAQWMGRCCAYAGSFFVKMIWPQLSTLSFAINFSKPRSGLWWPNLNVVAHQNLLDCSIFTYLICGHWKRPVVFYPKKHMSSFARGV